MKKNMYSKERMILVTMISLILIPGVYALHIYNKFVADNPEVLNNFSFWGKKFLVLIPIMVVAIISIHIVFAIINKIITNEDIPAISDEMDKIIELKAIRISRLAYSLCFILAMGSQALSMEPWVMFLILISSCFLGGIIEGIAKIYFYRKGV